MGLKKDMTVLDVGCGVGGPAREITRFSDVNIVGLNNNDYQIARATMYAEKAGLSHKQVRLISSSLISLLTLKYSMAKKKT